MSDRAPVELTKPFTLFVDRADGTGYSRDYGTLRGALRQYRLEIGAVAPARPPERVWVKQYQHSQDDGTVVAEWPYQDVAAGEAA